MINLHMPLGGGQNQRMKSMYRQAIPHNPYRPSILPKFPNGFVLEKLNNSNLPMASLRDQKSKIKEQN